jgi:hypothetical protein
MFELKLLLFGCCASIPKFLDCRRLPNAGRRWLCHACWHPKLSPREQEQRYCKAPSLTWSNSG